jgi:hypothetical protein
VQSAGEQEHFPFQGVFPFVKLFEDAIALPLFLEQGRDLVSLLGDHRAQV